MKRIKFFMAVCAAMVGLSASAWDGSAGKVYLQNVGSGLYWGAGDHLNWGTRAMLVENPEYVTLSLADGVYKLESQVSNGGSAYYFNGDYMDNAGPVSLTITQSGDYWTIANGSTYYGYNGVDSKAIQDNANGLTADSEGAKWIIRTHDEMLADLANGTVANPKDATFLFLDPGFGRNNRNVGSWTVSDDCTNKNLNGANNNNYGCGESYHSKFTISQSATVPNGVYKVSGRAFYRQDGSDNEHIPYLEANGQKSQFPLRAGTENSMQAAQQSFQNGSYAIDPMIVEVTDQSLTIKMVCEQTSLWCILDGFELAYYGPITLADLPLDEAYVNSYNTALNAAKAYQSQDMFDADKTALNDAISANEFDATTKKQGELESVQTAIANLNAAAAAAAEAVNQYTKYNTAVSTINGGTNVDLTSIIGNPDFEVNPVQYQLVDGGWTNEGVGIQYQNNTGFDGYKANTWFAERWVASGQIGALNTHQSLTLPAGIYELSVVATFNGNGASLYVGDAETAITDATTYKLLFQATDKEVVTFGIKAVSPTGSWLKADNFQLTYVGEDFPAYSLVEGKMSTAASTAQSNAETTFTGNKTVTNYNALLAAIAAAQVSKDAYAVAATAIADAKALQTNYTFVTPSAATTFAEAIAAIETPYTNGTLADADATAAGRTLGVVMVDWHAAATNTPASNYMISAWPSTYTINDWSWEGNNDGSNFKVPFFQDWVADGESLAAKTMTGTLTGLDNGLYQVSAWVRVRAKNETAATDATGITMDVNGGGEGEYAAVDVTEGTQVGSTQFQLGTYTAQGLVKDGNLTLNFNVLEGTNVSWLAYKNVTYTKVRDLTEEEMAVVPTAIALYNGEEEVTSTIALDATTTTVTLTPKYTPANATEGYINWVSSDESVATVSSLGEVTAVLPGTATITAYSTLDTEVRAEATVTVTFPETEVAASTYTNDGATRTVATLGENLIKNGAFEYPNNFYGWTTGGNADLSTSGFTLTTEEGNTYITAKNNAGGTDASSIRKVWSIENGKTYVFGFRIKGTGSGTLEWVRVSLTDELGAETNVISSNIALTSSWQEVKYAFTNDENKKYIQFWARWHQNVSYDDIYLCEATTSTEGNVQYALDAIPTANIGTGAFQYSQDAIDAAEALVQGTATVEDVEEAYDAVTTLNVPAEGQLFNIVNTSASYNHAGKAVTFKSASNADLAANTTSMGWTENPGSVYPQAVKFTAVAGEKNVYTLSYTRADGNTVYVSTGITSGLGNATTQIRPTTDAAKALKVRVEAAATTDTWYLWNTEEGKRLGANGADDQGLFTGEANNYKYYDMKLQKAVNNEVSLNIAAANQYGTLILPFAADVPTGITAYSVSATSGNTLTLVEEDAFKANTPYIVFAESGATATLEGLGSAYTDASYTEGLLTGVYAATEAPVGTYVLQNNDSKVGFYQVAEGQEPTVGANRAYLTAPAQGGVKAFFFDDTATAIQNVFDGVAAGEVYDLAGRKLQKLQKGVNIVNGKKVIVK